jgi:isoamylase
MGGLLDIGAPAGLGAQILEGGVQFAVASRHATRLEVCVFDGTGSHEIARYEMPRREHDVWSGFLPGAGEGLVYGYRAHGPYSPQEGHRFNPAKLLIDPYARALVGTFAWDNAHYGYVRELGDPNGAPDPRDNAAFTYKARVTPARKAFSPPLPGEVGGLIYELHCRGFTMRMPGLSPRERGTLLGLSSGQALDYIRALGVTAIELMPIHAFIDDHRLVMMGLKNYWGYNTISFFAPHPAYCAQDPVREMAAFVARAHDRGLGVILDVVYNHTAETDHAGPTLSFRGLDNQAYYRLDRADPSRYADVTGCGATLNATDPIVRRLIVDSLSYWVEAFGVDGFRFDLAPTLGLERDDRYNLEGAVFQAIEAAPSLRDRLLIAEPWDAAGGYSLGRFPQRWREWNDQSRDAVRRFWRGDERQAGPFSAGFEGARAQFRDRGRPRLASIAFGACHDGFTLLDLTRYAQKHNHANGEDNCDGSAHCASANYGVEGPSTDPALCALRVRQARNILASVLLSGSGAMILAGDEFGRTQQGNNNAYAQDNWISWLDWDLAAGAQGQAGIAFVKALTALRTELSGQWASGRVEWIAPRGEWMNAEDWALSYARCFGALLHGGGEDEPAFLIWFNAAQSDVRVTFPGLRNQTWRLRLCTFEDFACEDLCSGAHVDARGRSLLVFQSRPTH